MWLDVESWNGLGERVLQLVTKGREVVVNGRLSISTYSKEVNGIVVQMRKPVVKLTGIHVCGKKPTVQEETAAQE